MLRVAVLGAGRIGRVHALNVSLNRNARLVTVADPIGTAAETLAAERKTREGLAFLEGPWDRLLGIHSFLEA